MVVRRAPFVQRIPGCTMAESTTSTNSHINLGMKPSGKPVAGKRHDGFDEAGAGNVSMGAGLRASAKALE